MQRLNGSKPGPRVTAAVEQRGQWIDALFQQMTAELEPCFMAHGEAQIHPLDDVPRLKFGGELVFEWRSQFRNRLIVRLPSGAIAKLDFGTTFTSIDVASADRVVTNGAFAQLTDYIGPAENEDEGGLWVTFWSKQIHEVKAIRRQLDVSSWREMAGNYSDTTAAVLDPMMTDYRPTRSGLMLWTGEPGTGKSRAVEALADAWQDWCEPNFITDPEEFLWHGSWYMMHIATEKRSRARRSSTGTGGNRKEYENWQLIVLEDSGELLSVDASQKTGQGLARLLNLTDGALGHGLQTIVLVTTNEPLSKLHPAVTRPGRCLLMHEFDRLSAVEANAWLNSHGIDDRVNTPTTLAELYAILDGPDKVRKRPIRSVGFVA